MGTGSGQPIKNVKILTMWPVPVPIFANSDQVRCRVGTSSQKTVWHLRHCPRQYDSSFPVLIVKVYIVSLGSASAQKHAFSVGAIFPSQSIFHVCRWKSPFNPGRVFKKWLILHQRTSSGDCMPSRWQAFTIK